MEHTLNADNPDEYIEIEIENERKTQETLRCWVYGGVAIYVLGWWILVK